MRRFQLPATCQFPERPSRRPDGGAFVVRFGRDFSTDPPTLVARRHDLSSGTAQTGRLSPCDDCRGTVGTVGGFKDQLDAARATGVTEETPDGSGTKLVSWDVENDRTEQLNPTIEVDGSTIAICGETEDGCDIELADDGVLRIRSTFERSSAPFSGSASCLFRCLPFPAGCAAADDIHTKSPAPTNIEISRLLVSRKQTLVVLRYNLPECTPLLNEAWVPVEPFPEQNLRRADCDRMRTVDSRLPVRSPTRVGVGSTTAPRCPTKSTATCSAPRR